MAINYTERKAGKISQPVTPVHKWREVTDVVFENRRVDNTVDKFSRGLLRPQYDGHTARTRKLCDQAHCVMYNPRDRVRWIFRLSDAGVWECRGADLPASSPAWSQTIIERFFKGDHPDSFVVLSSAPDIAVFSKNLPRRTAQYRPVKTFLSLHPQDNRSVIFSKWESPSFDKPHRFVEAGMRHADWATIHKLTFQIPASENALNTQKREKAKSEIKKKEEWAAWNAQVTKNTNVPVRVMTDFHKAGKIPILRTFLGLKTLGASTAGYVHQGRDVCADYIGISVKTLLRHVDYLIDKGLLSYPPGANGAWIKVSGRKQISPDGRKEVSETFTDVMKMSKSDFSDDVKRRVGVANTYRGPELRMMKAITAGGMILPALPTALATKIKQLDAACNELLAGHDKMTPVGAAKRINENFDLEKTYKELLLHLGFNVEEEGTTPLIELSGVNYDKRFVSKSEAQRLRSSAPTTTRAYSANALKIAISRALATRPAYGVSSDIICNSRVDLGRKTPEELSSCNFGLERTNAQNAQDVAEHKTHQWHRRHQARGRNGNCVENKTAVRIMWPTEKFARPDNQQRQCDLEGASAHNFAHLSITDRLRVDAADPSGLKSSGISDFGVLLNALMNTA